MDERGSAGILFAVILLALGAGMAGVSAYAGRASDYGRRIEARERLRQRLAAAVGDAIDALAADETPESEGPRDRAWAGLGPREDGLSLSISELSSRLNANFTSAELLAGSPLRSLLASEASPPSLAAYREERGLSTELGHYRAFLAETSLDAWSCFGWANVNIADPSSLRSLYRSLTGSEEGAEAFSLRVAAARSAGRTIDPGSLEDVLGSAYPETYPIICTQAPHNVNFIPAPILRGILAYPPFGIAEPLARAEALLAAREDHDISEEELAAFLGEGSRRGPREGPLQYLGVRSWFWLVRAEAEGGAFSAVVASWPEPAGHGDGAGGPAKSRRLALVETRFEP
jgi:hypothetical protein